MRGTLILGAGAVCALAACGGSTSGAGSTPTPVATPTPLSFAVGPARPFGNACRLLSTSDVQSTLNQGMVAAAQRTDPQLGSFCTYTPTSGASVPLLTVEVIVRGSSAIATSQVDQTGGPSLSGVGDDARTSKPGGLGVALYFSKGDTDVTLSSIHKGVTTDQLTQIARTIAGKL